MGWHIALNYSSHGGGGGGGGGSRSSHDHYRYSLPFTLPWTGAGLAGGIHKPNDRIFVRHPTSLRMRPHQCRETFTPELVSEEGGGRANFPGPPLW